MKLIQTGQGGSCQCVDKVAQKLKEAQQTGDLKMIRYNIDNIKRALNELDKIKPFAFSKEDKDKLLDCIIDLQWLVKKYMNGGMALKPAGSDDYGCITGPGKVTEIDMSDGN